MDEVENQTVVQESTTPETSPQESPPQEAQVVQEDRQERNWREMRRVNDELHKKVKMQEEMMAQLIQKSVVPPSAPVDELDTIPDDDYIPKGKVKKLVQKAEERAEKIANEAVEKKLHELEKSKYLERLKSKFPDFEDVITPDTLDLLEQQDPDLAKTIASSGDPYSIGLQSYKYIKSMGLTEKVPGSRRVKEVEKKLAQNAKTVQTPQAFDKRPMAQTFQLTEAMKKDLWSEMERYASMADGVPPIG